MPNNIKISFLTLLLMISFASVNAVLFTPALPHITKFFQITEDTAQLTITWYLIGYACGQLLYGPIANRFGRKPALYCGITLEIFSSLLCVLSQHFANYHLLIAGRFLMALGAGVGLKMTFTLVNECFDPKEASRKIAYLMLAFAITPGLSVALGGFITDHFDWSACFYASAIYGLILLGFVYRLPETLQTPDLNALKLKHLTQAYLVQFKNIELISGGLLMGCSTCFVYVFAALAPFIAIDIFGISSAQYGLLNLLPPIGLIIGSLLSASLAKEHSLSKLIRYGIIISSIGSIMMLLGIYFHLSVTYSLFLPVIVVYLGICFISANTSGIAMSRVTDKAHGAAVMSFINMSTATIVVLSIGLFSIHEALLGFTYVVICLAMPVFYKLLLTYEKK